MEKLIRSIENENYKNIKGIAAQLDKNMSGMNADARQDYVNEVSRNLSEKGRERMKLVIDAYNKEHPRANVKNYDDVQKSLSDAVNKTSLLFAKYGERYGKTNVLVDNFVKAQFEEAVSGVRSGDLQDVIDSVSLNIHDDKIMESFKTVVKEYGKENNLRLRVSDISMAHEEATKLADLLKIDEVDKASLSEEDLARIKAEKVQDFKFALLETARTIKQDDFQALINELDKQLDYDGRKALDSAIRHNNKTSPEKYETRRVKLTAAEKDLSWQRIETDSKLLKKLHELNVRLDDIRNHKERYRDRSDGGYINGALRAFINLQELIAEALEFVAENIKYHTAREDDFTYDNKEDGMENNGTESDGPANPFYAVMMEAYSAKGTELADAINFGTLSAKEAEELFIMDVSYIRSLDAAKQNELFARYSASLNEAMARENMSVEARNTIRTFIVEFEKGSYNEAIENNIKNGCDWTKWKAKTGPEHGNDHDSPQNEPPGGNGAGPGAGAYAEPDIEPDIPPEFYAEYAEPEPEPKPEPEPEITAADKVKLNKGRCMVDARNYMDNIRNAYIDYGESEAGFDTPDELVQKVNVELEQFAYTHRYLPEDAIKEYQKMAVCVFLAFPEMIDMREDKPRKYEAVVSKLSAQFDDKDFHLGNDECRTRTLLKAITYLDVAEYIKKEYAEKGIDVKNGYDDLLERNILTDDAMRGLEATLLRLQTHERQQSYISNITSRINVCEEGFRFAAIIKHLNKEGEYNIRPESPRGMRTKAQVHKKAKMVADKYIQRAKTDNPRIRTKHYMVAMCEKIPSDITLYAKTKEEQDAIRNSGEPVEFHNSAMIYDMICREISKCPDNAIRNKALDLIEEDTLDYNSVNREIGAPEYTFNPAYREQFKGIEEEYIDEPEPERKPMTLEEKKAAQRARFANMPRSLKDEEIIETAKRLADALDSEDRDGKSEFVEWCKDKSYSTIRKVVLNIDKECCTPQACIDLVDAIEENKLRVRAPISEELVDNMRSTDHDDR